MSPDPHTQLAHHLHALGMGCPLKETVEAIETAGLRDGVKIIIGGGQVNDKIREYAWPTLKAVMLGLIEEGCIPVMFGEGSYSQRLKIIADLPKGKCIWWFDQTDMRRAKEILDDVCCIAGNVPTALMTAGTPDEVTAYYRELIEVAGKDGGFVLTNGCGVDHAKAENVKAMIEAGREYGVYR